jgi:hypothetical protein
VAELERLSLVAPPEEFAPLRVATARSIAGDRVWPSYERALDGAPPDGEGQGPDRSRADFVWCMTEITLGFGINQTAERLIEESSKARAAGNAYAELTVRNAVLAVERRRSRTRYDRLVG